MDKNAAIFVAGRTGLAGSAFIRLLRKKGYKNIFAPTHDELELSDQNAVSDYFQRNNPEYVFLAAAKVGGILANDTYPADFIYQNLMIQNSVIHQCFVHNIRKMIFLGSSCVYPKHCPQPIKEEYLMTGPLERTNSSYAVAKIAGIEMCWAYNRQYGTKFMPVMPTNLYGPNDNFDLDTSHVLPALIRKFHSAVSNQQESVTIWGTGKPRREFLHSDDLADACLHLMKIGLSDQEYKNRPLFNIGTGVDISIKRLALMIKDISGFKGAMSFDTSKPDGTPQKLLDISQISRTGWKPAIDLRKGIENLYKMFRDTGRK